MAVTSYGVNDPLAVKLWSKRLAVEVLKNVWAAKFMGTSSSSIIQIKDELQKSAGDKITYGLRMQLSGTGVLGDGTLEGNEESLTTYSDAVLLNQLRHAVRSAGRMSQQRVPFSIREEALSGLKDWWADRIDNWFFNQICGYVVQTQVQYTGLQSVIYPDNGHYLNTVAGSTMDDDLNSTWTFVLSLIDRSIERARTLGTGGTGTGAAIRPVKVGGKDFWVVFMHPYQVTDMRTNTSTGQWLDIQKAAMTGGEIDDNPIFDGALGVYNGAIMHSDVRVTQGVQHATINNAAPVAIANVRRSVMCGAQAAMLAFGRDSGPERYTWVEELFDYENELGVSAGLIGGLKKTEFNSFDFGVVTMPSWAAQH
jgi:N4-gp56 family major capsid protein